MVQILIKIYEIKSGTYVCIYFYHNFVDLTSLPYFNKIKVFLVLSLEYTCTLSMRFNAENLNGDETALLMRNKTSYATKLSKNIFFRPFSLQINMIVIQFYPFSSIFFHKRKTRTVFSNI